MDNIQEREFFLYKWLVVHLKDIFCFFLLQTPSAIDKINPPLAKFNTSVRETTRSNLSVVSGRQSPVYVAVPVDRPPVKVKPKMHASEQDTIDISTINELRSKLIDVSNSGWVQPTDSHQASVRNATKTSTPRVKRKDTYLPRVNRLASFFCININLLIKHSFSFLFFFSFKRNLSQVIFRN